MATSNIEGPIPFDPHDYLVRYFSDINDEYRSLYRFWARAVASLPRGRRALELGVGPTLYSAFPLAERFGEIVLADFVPGSLAELERWLRADDGAFDWTPYVELALQAEGKVGTRVEVLERMALLRSVVRDVVRCDLRTVQPLGREATFDLVSAHYCTEAASTSEDEWSRVLANVTSLVKPGGWLLLSVAAELSIYRTYDPSVVAKRSPNVTRRLVETTLTALGFVADSWTLEMIEAPEDRPYSRTCVVFAQLPSRTTRST